jgi:hypothetical protein
MLTNISENFSFLRLNYLITSDENPSAIHTAGIQSFGHNLVKFSIIFVSIRFSKSNFVNIHRCMNAARKPVESFSSQSRWSRRGKDDSDKDLIKSFAESSEGMRDHGDCKQFHFPKVHTRLMQRNEFTNAA